MRFLFLLCALLTTAHGAEKAEKAKKQPDFNCAKLERSICQEKPKPAVSKKNTGEGFSEEVLQRLFKQARQDLITTLEVENPTWKDRAIQAVEKTSLVELSHRKKLESRDDYKLWCGADGKSPNIYWSLRENQVMPCAGIYEWIQKMGEKAATPSLYHRFIHELVHTFASADEEPHALELFCDDWANRTLGYRLLGIRSKTERWNFLAASVQRFCVSEPVSETHPSGDDRLKQVVGELRILKVLGCKKK